jgi:hypothetical protein
MIASVINPHVYLAETALARDDAAMVRKHAQIALELAERTGNQWTRARVQDYLRCLEG